MEIWKHFRHSIKRGILYIKDDIKWCMAWNNWAENRWSFRIDLLCQCPTSVILVTCFGLAATWKDFSINFCQKYLWRGGHLPRKSAYLRVEEDWYTNLCLPVECFYTPSSLWLDSVRKKNSVAWQNFLYLYYTQYIRHRQIFWGHEPLFLLGKYQFVHEQMHKYVYRLCYIFFRHICQ